ncbi:helix-turn-helix domain-containing protein [Streptomyces xiamenensis]
MSTDPPSDRVLQRRQEIGRQIRDARVWANLSQERLAELAGVSRDTIVRVETGTRSARLDWLIQIADALEVDLAELVRQPRR